MLGRAAVVAALVPSARVRSLPAALLAGSGLPLRQYQQLQQQAREAGSQQARQQGVGARPSGSVWCGSRSCASLLQQQLLIHTQRLLLAQALVTRTMAQMHPSNSSSSQYMVAVQTWQYLAGAVYRRRGLRGLTRSVLGQSSKQQQRQQQQQQGPGTREVWCWWALACQMLTRHLSRSLLQQWVSKHDLQLQAQQVAQLLLARSSWSVRYWCLALGDAYMHGLVCLADCNRLHAGSVQSVLVLPRGCQLACMHARPLD